MTLCKACGHENIAGVDDCESCSIPLAPKTKRGLPAKIEEGTLADLKPRKAVAVPGDISVADAARTMRAEGTGCVLVLENGKVRGIMTERDILFGVAGLKSPESVKVRDIMHQDPVCLTSGDPVSYAFHHMSVGGYRHIPVLDGGKPAGMVSARDLLRYIAEPVS